MHNHRINAQEKIEKFTEADENDTNKHHVVIHEFINEKDFKEIIFNCHWRRGCAIVYGSSRTQVDLSKVNLSSRLNCCFLKSK
jgi:hypothetical protein